MESRSSFREDGTRRFLIAFVVLLVVTTAAKAQWLEDSICIADTLSGLKYACCLAYDSADNIVFVAGEATEKILVLDASDGRRLGWIPYAGNISSLCYNPISNKVYAPDGDSEMVAVIDAGTRQVVETLAIGSGPYTWAFNRTMNRAYCANRNNDNVTVVDGEADSTIGTIDVGYSPRALCWNPTRNVVYCADYYDSTVSVIDAATDTVINTMRIGGRPNALLYNLDLNKLYVSSRGQGLVVLDGLVDTVLTVIEAVRYPFKLCYNPVNSKMYAADANDERVIVVDCITDSLLGYIERYADDVAYNARDNRLYMADDYGVAVADGTTDSILWASRVGYYARAVCVADSGRRAFCAVDEENLVGVFDCAGESLLTLIGTDIDVRPSTVCFNPTANKAYCAVEGTNEVMVIDGADNTVRQVLPVGWGTKALLYSSAGNKVYCVNSGDHGLPADLTVIDGSGDSILRKIETGSEGAYNRQILCQNPAGDRLYEAINGDQTVIVFDAVADTIVCRVPLPTSPYAICYGSAYDYVYVVVSNAVDVIDAEQNIMIAEVDVGSHPIAICYVPTGAKVYTADKYGGTVSVIAGERPERVAQIDVGGSPYALVRDSHDNKVYCTNYDTSVAVIDASADTLVALVPLGRSSDALCYDSLNNRVYCACSSDSSVVVIDCRNDSVIATIHVGATPIALAWNPIELRTYVANYSGASISIIRDSLYVGVGSQPQASSRKPQATVFRGVLNLGVDSRQQTGYRAELLDAAGRRVMILRAGANDVRALAPGVYFVVTPSPSSSLPEGERVGVRRHTASVTKVVVTR
jgi:YVTN family beta-propeller protein